MGIGALTSQLGAWLGGHFASTLPLTTAIAAMSLACVSTMIFLVPRRMVSVSEAVIVEAEEDGAAVM
jgi:DHA1 family bicyclomycin/chloramphenicol resistance-like MFS transporter